MNKQLRILLIITFLVGSLIPGNDLSAQEQAGSGRLRIGITQDGIYKVVPGDLAGVGLDPATVDPRTFAMSSLGGAVAIQVEGEEDGVFSGNDAVVFFAEKFRGEEMEEKYTDERVYWLDMGGAAGPRIAVVPATPLGNIAAPVDFAGVVRAEEDHLWYTLHKVNPPSKDTWFWDEMRPVMGERIQRDFLQAAPYPLENAAATLALDLNARSTKLHQVEIAVNGQNIGVVDWSGQIRHHVQLEVPAGILMHPETTVSATVVGLPGAGADHIYFNYWELQYRRLFRAWEGQLDFNAEGIGTNEYESAGWDSSDIWILEIGDPTAVKRLTGFTTRLGENGLILRFRAQDEGDSRYWMQKGAQISAPASILLREPTGLRAPASGADTVIVTSAELRPAADVLAQWHEDKGRRALVAEFGEVVDEFNEGIYHPTAVPTMLAWAQDNWPGPAPSYLTLVGDGHWNFKLNNLERYPFTPNHIPPFLAWVDPTQGEVPADPQYGDFDYDRKPDLAVGRLAVNTLGEAYTVVQKIIDYDDSGRFESWQEQTIFVADDPDTGGNFPYVSDLIINEYIPTGMDVERIYLGETVPDADSARDAIRQAINEGAWMLQYTGHGAPSVWAQSIWRLADIPTLDNGSMLPVVMTFNCLDGYFAYPSESNFSIAEVMQRQSNAGAVALISPSGLGFTHDQYIYRTHIMDAMFLLGEQTMGDILLHAQHEMYDDYAGPHYLIDTMMLYGDPAMRIPAIESDLRLYLPAMLG